MRAAARIGRIAFGVFLTLHGAVHAMGVLGSWEVKTFEDISYQPNVLLTDASDGMMRLLGALWLAAGLALIGAGIGVIRRAAWWPLATLASATLSLAVTLLWKDDAPVGVAINIALLLAIGCWTAMAPRWTPRTRPSGGQRNARATI